MDSGPSDPDDDLGSPSRINDIDTRAVAAARAVHRKPLEADEQVTYDKIKSGAYKGSILNPKTGEMEPLD